MSPSSFTFAALWVPLLLDLPSQAKGGKVLVIPQDTDVWLDMRPVIDQLKLRGHKIVVVIPKNTLLLGSSEEYTVRMYTAPVPGLSLDLETAKEESLMGCFLGRISTMYRRMKHTASVLCAACQHLLEDQELLRYLERSSFDTIVMDPLFPCGPILAEHLSLPPIYFLPGLPCGWDSKATQCPNPFHYNLGQYLAQMGFIQRVQNLLVRSLEHVACQQINAEYTSLASHFLHRDVKMLQLFSQAELWLFKYDFVMEYPKPVMPNMVFIGGDNCAERKNLSQVSAFVFRSDPIPTVRNSGASVRVQLGSS
ncbi:hypothetical protein FKM82_016022 [Ascaphus truei]